MNTHRHATQRTLHEWEKELETLFRDIRLVGELPLGNPGRAELAQQIRALIKRHGLTQATHLLEERYPRSFLTYLALTASRNEERGFWDVVAREVGVVQSGQFFHPSHHWGRLFLKLVADFGLETFSSVDSGRQYVTPIRLHGGIPAYSLPDFFEEVLLPAVQKPQYAGMDVPELIEQVLQRPAVQHVVDSPVRYFLQYGGETAQDFFAHCLEMARAWEEQSSLPSAKELGLPRYVMRAFQDFMEGRLQTPRGKRLRAPRLHLEPYDPEYLYSLELPEEPIDADRAGWRYTWRITAHTEVDEEELAPVSVRVRRSGGALVAAGDTLWLDQPPARLRVEFQAQETESGTSRVIGRWFLDLAPPADEPLLLAFRPRDGRPVRRDATLPADELWLMLPADLDVQAPRQGRLIAHAPKLGSAWAAWKIELWDLTRAQVLHLVEPESGEALHTLQVQVSSTEPRLLDGGRLDAELDQEEAPFYVGEPPRLWLPRLTGHAPEEEMAAWRVQVSAVGDADPMPPSREATLMELAGQVDDEGFLLPMVTLLGDQAAGAYTVEVWGPRRFYSELAFRIWPALAVEELASYYLPGPRGPEPAVFYVQTRQADQVAASVEATGVQVEATESPGRHRVTVAGDATLAELILSQSGPEKAAIQVPLRLRIPRLCWTVRLIPGEVVWTTQPLIVPVDKLLQSQRPYLILAWESAQAAPEGRVVLLDAEKQSGEVLQEKEVVGLAQSNRMGIDLGLFHDTLAATPNASLLTLALVLDGNVAEEPVPLLHLRRELGVSVALLEWTDAGTVVLRWEAVHRLRSRRVRVWSAWRPWEPACEYAIPDAVAPEYPHDSSGSGAFEIGEILPPGLYWVAFRTAPEWEPLNAPLFPTEDSLLAESDEKDAQERLETIQNQLEMGRASPFLTAFERACIFHAQGNLFLRDREVEQAIDHMSAGYPRVIVALSGWLQRENPDLARKLRVRMYRPEALERLFNAGMPQAVLDAYLVGFSDTRLIKPESARLVLDHTRNPEWRARATSVLIKRIDDIPAVVNMVKEGVFSEEIGLDLLAENSDRALTVLHDMPVDLVRDKLLLRLAIQTRSGRVIRPGIWVRSGAGWGQLAAIHVGDEARPYLFLNEAGCPEEESLLIVKLHRNDRIWQLEIDTAKKELHLLGATQVYRCTRDDCTGFASVDRDEVLRAHCTTAHLGMGPAYKKSTPKWRYHRPIAFSWHVQHPYA